MTKKLRYIFIFIFLLSVCSLTLQASIISICKESKAFKSQNQTNPVTEEEEEGNDGDEDVNEILFTSHEHCFVNSISVNKSYWSKSENDYLSFTKSIPIPPPKF